MVQRLTVMSAIACDSQAIPGWQLDLMAKRCLRLFGMTGGTRLS